MIIYEINRHDSITFQIKDIVFSTEIDPRSPVGEAEYTPLHNWGDDNTQWSIINKEDIHDIKMYLCISIISLMFIFMTTNKIRQCYPLCFSSWQPIKNNSVTPCVFFHDDQ